MASDTSANGAAASRLQSAWLSRGPLACGLWPLSLLFRLLTAARRALYRAGLLRRRAVAVPVIVVGNIVAGGAGKTPTVIALIDILRRHGFQPGIVSRGYGGSNDGLLEVTRATPASVCGDEPLLMHLRTGAPVVVGRDRVAAAERLLALHPDLDLIVADDGLQHLRLQRAAQVIVFDERGAGNGWLLPAGPLREPLPRTLPPRSVVVYNADAATTPLPGVLARRGLSGVVALADWWQAQPASAAALAALRGRPVIAAAGVARPERFFSMLRAHGLTIVPLPLPDHHDYATLPWPTNAGDVIVTEKDAIKLRPDRTGAVHVWVAPLDFAFDAALATALLPLLPSPASTSGPETHGNATA